MTVDHPRPILAGKKALVVGIANGDSIACGCAKAFREVGADVAKPGELEALFARIEKEWGQLDIMDIGFTCAYPATPYARRLTGETMYVDGGVNIMA
jgi:enoyl-[acyl-carrier-protein] reductase (NADH)